MTLMLNRSYNPQNNEHLAKEIDNFLTGHPLQ